MITRNDWNAAMDAWVAGERERLGGPPTAEEVVAYARGTLERDQAARIRALLVYYPELTSSRVAYGVRSLPRLLPIAAGLLLALLTALLVLARFDLAEKTRAHQEPYVHQTRHELQALRARGGTSDAPLYELPGGEDRYLLAIGTFEELRYRTYRLEIVDISAAEPRIVWRGGAAQPVDGKFELSLPRVLIATGMFRIDLYGVEGDRADRLESFRVRVRADG